MAAPTDPIKAAFENAIRDFKASLGDEKLLEDISRTKSIEDVYDATDALQKEQAAKGRLRHLAKIEPYLEGLRSYASVIEIFIQSKQDVLSLIWGPIKLLLHWANNIKQSFDAIIDVLADIGLLLPEFQEVRKLFSHNEHIKDVLVFFFRDILDFYLIVLKFFRKTYLKVIFESMWPKQREKINIVRAQIQRHTLLLRREVGLEHIQEAHNAQLQAMEHYEKTEKSFRRQEYHSIRISISPKTYEDILDSFQVRVCRGTGQWLLKDTTFIKWLDKSDTTVKVLWLQGIPGAGKSFLSSIAIHKAMEAKQRRTIYAFLSYRFRSSSSALSILHSLIFQLASGYDDLEDVLCQAGGEILKSSVDAAANLLRTLLACAGPTYILIDGIDEIDEMERCRFLKQVLEVVKVCQEVKVLISSRAEADIADLLKDQASIRVDSRNAGSIQKFVNHRTAQWFDRCNFLPEARAEIQGLLAPLASNAKGMFLYAEVVLSSMDSLDDIGEIRDELRVLPENLDAAYSRILDRINRLSPPLKDRVRKILGWVGCTPMPLTVREIEQALVVSREGVEGNAKVISILNMPRICGPIVEVVDEQVQFVHFTVKEYFFSSSINGSLSFVEATLSLTTCCVIYLCQMHHDYDISEEDIKHNILSGAYRLHDFAALMWTDLLKRYINLIGQESPSDQLIDALETLRTERTKEVHQESAGSSTPLYLECFKSISPPLHDIICKAVHFRELCLESNFDKLRGPLWTHLDPLTISTSSVRIYHGFSNLLCQNNNHESCHCEEIQRHYGQRPFKCRFLGCKLGRYGFNSRSLQTSHMKHHDRPWTCSVEDCEYARGGFVSRKMRDDHYRDHIASENQEMPGAEELDGDEIQPLLFDLVKANKVDAVRVLRDQITALPSKIEIALKDCAASFGSAAMIDLIEPFNVHRFPLRTLRCALKAGNIDLFKYLLSRSKDCNTGKYADSYSSFFDDVLTSDSDEVFEEWERYVDVECGYFTRTSATKSSVPFVERYTQPRVIRVTAGNPSREISLISFWERIGVRKSLDRAYLGSALVNVAMTTCSVKLAKYWVSHGAEVDFRRSDLYLTPLHHAARQNSAAAAEMMEYLLLQGADPERKAGRASLKIRDEKGAKAISQWLGKDWDQVVAEAKEERARMVEQSM